MNSLYTTPLTTPSECAAWFKGMYDIGRLFHPEDDPATIGIFTEEEVTHINARIDECFALLDDPCQVALDASGFFAEEE